MRMSRVAIRGRRDVRTCCEEDGQTLREALQMMLRDFFPLQMYLSARLKELSRNALMVRVKAVGLRQKMKSQQW